MCTSGFLSPEPAERRQGKTLLACFAAFQLACGVVKALEELSPEDAPDQALSKGCAKMRGQAASCLAAAASMPAGLALHAAAEARTSSNAAASSHGRSTTVDENGVGESSCRWPRTKELTETAVLRIELMLSSADLHDSVAQPCKASLAPAAAELRFLTALQGQHKLQASLDRLFAETWRQQGSPASAHSACSGCQLSQLVSPQVTLRAYADSMTMHVGSAPDRGDTGQQLAQLAADAALQPIQEPWRSLHRGRLHLLSASQLQREGETSPATMHRLSIETHRQAFLIQACDTCDTAMSMKHSRPTVSETVQLIFRLNPNRSMVYTGDLITGLAEAAEALRHSGAAMHHPDAAASSALGKMLL